jgi:hypothetical protein
MGYSLVALSFPQIAFFVIVAFVVGAFLLLVARTLNAE